jgi:hypothetical protein
MGSLAGSPIVSYRVFTDAPRDGELDALVSIYALALKKSEEGQGGGPKTAPDDAENVRTGAQVTGSGGEVIRTVSTLSIYVSAIREKD